MSRKLSEDDLALFRQVLLSLRLEVRGDIDDLEADAFGLGTAKDGSEAKPDGGVEQYWQEFSLELLELDETTLGEIDDALERLREGTFGLCEACDTAITKTRLRMVPYARRCIDCQRAIEKGS